MRISLFVPMVAFSFVLAIPSACHNASVTTAKPTPSPSPAVVPTPKPSAFPSPTPPGKGDEEEAKRASNTRIFPSGAETLYCLGQSLTVGHANHFAGKAEPYALTVNNKSPGAPKCGCLLKEKSPYEQLCGKTRPKQARKSVNSKDPLVNLELKKKFPKEKAFESLMNHVNEAGNQTLISLQKLNFPFASDQNSWSNQKGGEIVFKFDPSLLVDVEGDGVNELAMGAGGMIVTNYASTIDLLAQANEDAIKFALAHEVGHQLAAIPEIEIQYQTFYEKELGILLPKYSSISGAGQEWLGDLWALHLLTTSFGFKKLSIQDKKITLSEIALQDKFCDESGIGHPPASVDRINMWAANTEVFSLLCSNE